MSDKKKVEIEFADGWSVAYSPLQVANTFIDLAASEKEHLSVMKLLKLVYLAHGWNLAITNEPLINEPVEAWQYGPVISSVYHEFKSFGNEPINEKAVECYGTVESLPKESLQYKVVKKVWDVYKQFTGIHLFNKTHEPDTPWSKTWTPDVPRGTDIDNDLIKSHFQKLASH